MNEKLASDALYALTAKGFETYKGFCSRWCRQVCEYSYGDARYDHLWRPDDDPSAKDAALAFQHAGFAVKGEPQIGDILFKTVGSGGFGHVGILTPKGVAENSSYHYNRSNPPDARGIRSLQQFGAYQVVVRLPALSVPVVTPAQPLLLWNSYPPMNMVMVNGRPYALFSDLCGVLNQDVMKTTDKTGEEPPRFYVRTQPKK